MKGARPTLLVVDDEPEVLHSVHDLLRLDYRVLTRERGADALAILETREPVHVVMSDQRMPGMTGVELLSRARELRPDATRLLFTAYADIHAVIDAINTGSVFRYVTKPWDPEELATVVRQAVEQHDLVAERDSLLLKLRETNARLIEANRLKSAFIEVASHELNTPVAVVLGLAQLWKLTQAPTATPSERQWVDRIHHAGRRLAGTVERMLELIRADELARPLQLSEVDLATLVHEVVAGAEPFLEARHQRVSLDLDPALGGARIDAPKIGDALTNLLINAIKFSPDRSEIRIAAHPERNSGHYEAVRVSVTDTGVGIPAETRAYVFEPFFTGFDTMHHSSGEFEFCKRGIGLGLCLVKRFVSMHGGSVEVHSEPGAGSTFSFLLPRTPPLEDGPSDAPASG